MGDDLGHGFMGGDHLIAPAIDKRDGKNTYTTHHKGYDEGDNRGIASDITNFGSLFTAALTVHMCAESEHKLA